MIHHRDCLIANGARTLRRFSSDTGCPPPELFVIVTMTSTTRIAIDQQRPLQETEVHVPPERMQHRRDASLSDHQVPRLGILDFDVRARRVEVRVVEYDLPPLQNV
jgi:hypothetical protein